MLNKTNLLSEHDVIIQVDEIVCQTFNSVQVGFNCGRTICWQVGFVWKYLIVRYLVVYVGLFSVDFVNI